MLVKINELASLIGFYTNNDLIYRMDCGCLNEWMCGNYTEAFSAGYICHQTPGCLALYVILDFKWRRILKAKPSKRNVLDLTTHIFILFLHFLLRYIPATLLTEEALDISFFYRRFLSAGLKIISTSLHFSFWWLVRCGLRLSDFYIRSVVHFKWEQLRGTKSTPSCTPLRDQGY